MDENIIIHSHQNGKCGSRFIFLLTVLSEMKMTRSIMTSSNEKRWKKGQLGNPFGLMFALGDKDVFAHSDTSLLKAIKVIYGEGTVQGSIEFNALQKKWSPFKTVACLLLWSWIDAKMPNIEA